jgi:hypothetical protein
VKAEFLNEPRLEFASSEHICPRRGIATYGVYDAGRKKRRDTINVGAVGTNECLEGLFNWFSYCTPGIDAPVDARHPNLTLAFPGIRKDRSFATDLIYGEELSRAIKDSDLKEILKIEQQRERINAALTLYYEEVKFLAQNRQVDVIVCVIPTRLYNKIAVEEPVGEDEKLEEVVDATGELNFRRALKARAMHLGKPLQLLLENSLKLNQKNRQADCVKAWNLCTALYYKSGPVVPWRLKQQSARFTTCAVGIAFYRSRDYSVTNTSLAQIFDELGTGIILRGTPVDLEKDDRVPHLKEDQAHDLLLAALEEYRIALKNYPARLVVHKSSRFDDAELRGLKAAGKALKIDSIDFVTVLDSRLRLLRNGNYPPYRGTLLHLDDGRHVLYSRGSVWYYCTYPGLYIPEPIELRIAEAEESPSFLAREILGLTKMNWNNTQFDGKYPVTLGCARKVGEILKYLDEHEPAQTRYAYYM